MGLRINDSSRTTTTTTANDDYLLIDGTTNGTRNILASKFPLDTTVVHKTGNETIAGAKTFSNDITNNANEILTNTTFANQKGIIYKSSEKFLHDFNYGNNGTVTTTGRNIFLGVNAGNTTMGSTATSSSQASFNVGIGGAVLTTNTTGYNNVVIGHGAMLTNTTGYNNVAIGYTSGRYITGGVNVNQTSNNSVYIGTDAKAKVDGGTNETVIGYGAIGNGSNTATIGNTSVTDLYANQSGTATVHAGKFQLSALNTAPASATATGTTGEIRFDANYMYVCVATNTWKRSALTTW